MSQSSPTDPPKQYFLGIEGEQSGPFTQAEVILRIRQGSVPLDTLVWYEGLADWKSVANFDVFREALQSGADGTSPPVSEQKNSAASLHNVFEAGPKTKSIQLDKPKPSTFATDGDNLAPIFDSNEAAFNETPFVRFRFVFISIGLIVLFAVSGGVLYLKILTESATKKVVVPTAKTAEVNTRMNALRKAESELGLTPEESVKALQALITGNAIDPTGKRAIEVLVTHFKRGQKFQEAGEVFMAVKQYEQAANFYMMEPMDVPRAEEALSKALEDNKTSNRKEMLHRSVKLSLGPGGNRKLGMERIDQLEKEFPREAQPYAYYLKPPEQRIAEVFSRISYFYVNGLMAFIAAQFPQLNLVNKPMVEIRRNKEGKYRITGVYHGEVIFNQDRIKNISFTFWYHNDQWALTETNLTRERAKWAEAERKRLQDTALDAETLTVRLETLFGTEFPKQALHDPIPRRENATSPPARSGGLAPVPSRNR